ncbi:LPS export ABC transporter periplasmic protein LptC [Marinimicrobium sp. ARAG 43.8]|uniref:LPS export ABC transporter periplasmic protein LptC n=1 Tax=Marinimicrobium sp. ARAG 43.8 TaxID=3418719 RepID=UPI003CF85D64
MWRKPRTWIGLFLLVALAALWDYSPKDLMRDPAPEETRAHYPQAYIIRANTHRYDTEGQLHYHLLSARVDHFQRIPGQASPQDYSLFLTPRLTLHGESPQPWNLNANLGRSDATGDKIRLTGEVHLWQQAQAGTTELNTPELLIEPNRQYAETDKTVNMRSPRGRQEAVGMQADLGNDIIELLSEVRGIHEPPNSN